VVLSTDCNDIATFDLAQIIPSNQERQEQNSEKRFDRNVSYEYLYNGFHSGPITSLDICLQRPLIVTACRQDSTVRVWNYLHVKCDLASKFQFRGKEEEGYLNTVAFHPSGYYLAIAFSERLRLFHLMHRELRLFKELNVEGNWLIEAQKVIFSNGGQYLVLTQQKRSGQDQIMILTAYSFQIVQCIRSQDSIVGVLFSPNDSHLTTCSEEGKMCRYDLQNFSAVKSEIPAGRYRGLVWQDGVVAYGSKVTWVNTKVVPTKNENGERNPGGESAEKQVVERVVSFDLKGVVHSLTLDAVFWLCVGDQNGSLRVLSEKPEETPALAVHDGAVNCLQLSADGKYLFSAGADGNIFIFQVNDLNRGAFAKDFPSAPEEGELLEDDNRTSVVDEQLADLLLVHSQDIQIYMDEQIK